MPYDGEFMTEFIEKTHATKILSERELHLVGLAVTMTRGCTVCTSGRIGKARQFGLSDEILNALTRVVAAVNAGVAARTAATAFAEAPGSGSVTECTDGTCEVPVQAKS